MGGKEGLHLGQYRLVRLLGTGRFSEVYLGEHSYLGGQVALKLLPTRLAGDVQERFLAEARTLQKLEHQHIIGVLDFGIEDEVAYLVMDYAAGGTVRTPYPAGQPLPLPTVVSYVQQIVSALHYVHEHQMMHRDLKPENLLLDQDGRVLLGDFGLALGVSQSPDYAPTAMQGSLAYMAPEQFRGRPQRASDQYALGVIVYEWLSGTRPFHGTFAELCHAHLYVPPPPLSQYSPEISPLVEQVVLTALSKEPGRRFADVQTFAAALVLAQAGCEMQHLLPPVPSSSLSPSRHMTGPAAAGPSMTHYRIPFTLTPLIGRDGPSKAILHLLMQPEVRLLTLTGPGGIGKTRLALFTAHDMQEAFADGVCFVDLSAVHDTKLVISTIAEVLVEQQTGNRPVFEVVETFLRNKHFLLVIDNFEQVVKAAPQLTDLLSLCPDLKVLVTSREPLHVQGEHEFLVPPLELPSLEQGADAASLLSNSAIVLFVQRAQAIKPDFSLQAADAHIVAEICTRLDGLPLALELAAARIKLLPPRLLLSRLSNSLNVLTKGRQDAPAHHRTLRDTIKWSYNLLEEPEQLLFRRLCIFVGGCTLEAIEALYHLLGDDPTSVVDGLDSLMDKNLIKFGGQSREGVRILFLETIREFGLECLQACDEFQGVQQAHAHYYAAWAETGCQELFGPEQLLWMDDLMQGMGNLRAVMRFVIEKAEWEMALQVAAALGPFWLMVGTSTQRLYMIEGAPFMWQALEGSTEKMTALRVRALAFYGTIQSWLGDTERGKSCCREALEVSEQLGDMQEKIHAHWGLCHTFFARCDLRTAYQMAQQAVTLSRQHATACTLWGAAWTQGISYFNVGLIAVHDGHYAEGKTALRESTRLCSRSGDRIFPIWSNLLLGEIIALEGKDDEARLLLEQSRTASRTLEMKALESEAQRYLGLLALREGDIEQVNARLSESLRLAREVDDTQCIIWALIWYARVKMVQQQFDEARALLEEGLETSLRRDDKLTLPAGLEGLGYVVATQGKPIWAVQLFGTAQALRETMGVPLPPIDRLEYEGQVATVRTQLHPAIYRTAWIQGRDLTVEQVLSAQGEMRETVSVEMTPPSITPISAQAAALGVTRRELDVLRLLAQGLTNAQIAEQLVLSVVTVNSYLRSIYSKFGVSTRTAAMRYALDHHLI